MLTGNFQEKMVLFFNMNNSQTPQLLSMRKNETAGT
jgi:hypothetical protein